MSGAGPEGREPTEEELRAALEEELSRIQVADVLLQTVVSLINLGGRRAGLAGGGEGERDMAQVQAAIEGVQALLPVIEAHTGAGADELRPIRDALSQLQMAYARGGGPGDAPGEPAAAAPATDAGEGPPAPEPGPGDPAGPPGEGPGPAQSSGKLWVPGQ